MEMGGFTVNRDDVALRYAILSEHMSGISRNGKGRVIFRLFRDVATVKLMTPHGVEMLECQNAKMTWQDFLASYKEKLGGTESIFGFVGDTVYEEDATFVDSAFSGQFDSHWVIYIMGFRRKIKKSLKIADPAHVNHPDFPRDAYRDFGPSIQLLGAIIAYWRHAGDTTKRLLANLLEFNPQNQRLPCGSFRPFQRALGRIMMSSQAITQLDLAVLIEWFQIFLMQLPERCDNSFTKLGCVLSNLGRDSKSLTEPYCGRFTPVDIQLTEHFKRMTIVSIAPDKYALFFGMSGSKSLLYLT
jgi:hypothetical protein